MPINLAALLFSPKAWAVAGVGLVVMFAGIQTMRLQHAKADQWDRGACVKGQLCKAVKWKDEVARLRPELVRATADLVTCTTNEGALKAALGAQNASVAAWKAEGARRTAEAAAALGRARTATASANRSAAAILAAKAGADVCASADALILGSVK